MRPRHPETRSLTEAESAILRRALDLADFRGRSELQKQVSHTAVAGGTEFALDLVVVAEIAPSLAGAGPIPTRALVLAEQGEPLGEVVVWVTGGYLSGLEYAWFTDDPPSILPSPDQLVVV